MNAKKVSSERVNYNITTDCQATSGSWAEERTSVRGTGESRSCGEGLRVPCLPSAETLPSLPCWSPAGVGSEAATELSSARF